MPETIPYTLYPASGKAPSFVFFLIHGHTGNRFDPTIVKFAEAIAARGQVAVAVDAFRHGERKTEPYVTLDGTAIATAMGPLGHYAPLGDPGAGAEAITRALRSQDGVAARERIATLFPLERREGGLLALVDEIAGARP